MHSEAPRSPVAVRVLPNGFTVPAPDVVLPEPFSTSSPSSSPASASPFSPSVAALKSVTVDTPHPGAPQHVTSSPKASAAPASERFNPEERANCCSRLTYHYVTPLIELGNSRPLQVDDMWPVAKSDESQHNTAELTALYNKRKAAKPGYGGRVESARQRH